MDDGDVPAAHPIQLTLRPGKRHRVLNGHPWVFSNQLADPPKGFPAGSPIVLHDHGGRFVGTGYGHPNTLIAARLLDRNPAATIDADWVEARLRAARDLRLRACPGRSAWRWVHGESDGLPGLIIDRFPSPEGADRVVLAANTAGMERLAPLIVEVLRDRLGVESGLWKCDGRGRKLEGLPARVEAAWGEPPPSPWLIEDDGLTIAFDPWGGQKTGLFLDMWENRRRMVPALASAGPAAASGAEVAARAPTRVADLFSYVGQWGLHAARAGASDVVCVDRSQAAVDLVADNASRNGLAGQVTAVRADVKAWLKEQAPGSFDAVVCDPPAYIQSKKDVSAGLRAYRSLFSLALGLVRPGGFAVLASCSHHLYSDRFAELVGDAAGWAKRDVRVIARGGQAPCHPVPMTLPEASYLKCWLVQAN